MKIVIFGSGGVGGYFGGRLAASGEDVTFIARGQHLRALQERGLRVESIKGDFSIPHVSATDDLTSIPAPDLVIVAVKTWQINEAADALRPIIAEHTTVLPLLNGVEAPAILSDALGAQHVLGGLCRIFSHIAAPGVIRHLSAEPYIALNEQDNRESVRVRHIHHILTRAGISTEIAPDIAVAMWTKFAFVCSTGTIGAVTRMPFGVIRSVPETRDMLEQAVREIIEVAHAHTVALPEDTFNHTMTMIDNTAADATTSMQRDIIEGRASELDGQTGAVVRLGRAVGIGTPVHAHAYGFLLPQEQRARGA